MQRKLGCAIEDEQYARRYPATRSRLKSEIRVSQLQHIIINPHVVFNNEALPHATRLCERETQQASNTSGNGLEVSH